VAPACPPVRLHQRGPTVCQAWDLTLILVAHWHVPLLTLAIGLGTAAHIVGDELTHGGCPIFWPFSEHEFHLLPRPLQITTAKLAENWIIFPLLTGALVLAVWHATGHLLLYGFAGPLSLPKTSSGW
jgi:membrane-bound metal-dependent hydrolase YbcI (DUF457 family)